MSEYGYAEYNEERMSIMKEARAAKEPSLQILLKKLSDNALLFATNEDWHSGWSKMCQQELDNRAESILLGD